MRSSGMLVGAAILRPTPAQNSVENRKTAVMAGRAGNRTIGVSGRVQNTVSSSREDCIGVYLSGFRIVQDAMLTRHAEYRVVLISQRYERWHRFSELKALARLPALSEGAVADATRDSWDAVRACKAPQGGSALDPKHLSKKCLAIEKFLCLLLEEIPAEMLAQLLSNSRPSSTPRRPKTGPGSAGTTPWSRQHGLHTSSRGYGAYLAPNLQRPARTAGSTLRMR